MNNSKNITTYIDAEKLFSRQTVLQLMPKPRNKTVEDIKLHVRKVLFGRMAA